jgi:hypothetical protein
MKRNIMPAALFFGLAGIAVLGRQLCPVMGVVWMIGGAMFIVAAAIVITTPLCRAEN